MNTIIKEAEKLIDQGSLGRALDFIAHESKEAGIFKVSEKAESLLIDYNYMLQYFTIGAKDPHRSDMLADICDKAYNLITDLRNEGNSIKCQSGNIAGISSTDTDELFKAIRTNYPATSEDRSTIQQIILDDATPLYIRGMVVSALTLNLLEYFDNEKFESLYAYTLEDLPVEIRARAWVAIVLVTMANDHRISTQPRLVEQMKFICEEGTTTFNDDNSADLAAEHSLLMKIQIALYLCLEAFSARDYYNNNVTPTIQKSIQTIEQYTGKDSKLLTEDDINPEWAEKLNTDELREKMDNFVALFKDGIDIMYESFSNSLHMSFFLKEANWFMPFTIDQPDIAGISVEKSKETYLKFISWSQKMTALDKYSSALMVNLIPDNQIKLIEDTITENQLALDHVDNKPDIDNEIVNYLHDLFRYFTLCKKRSVKHNPFSHNLYFGRYELLSNVTYCYENKADLSELLMKYHRYQDARILRKELLEKQVDKENLQKYAYCMMKDDPDNPVYGDVLAMCNNYYPGDLWTIKHYADALILATSYRSAEIVLIEGLKFFPDDISLLLLMAKSIIKQERYEEALKYLFHADILQEGNSRVMRHIAWCSFMLGNKENAEKYIAPLLGEQASSSDWINSGHIALLNGNIPLAIERYLHSNPDDLYFAFIDDCDKMRQAGIAQEVITLTHEAVIKKSNL